MHSKKIYQFIKSIIALLIIISTFIFWNFKKTIPQIESPSEDIFAKAVKKLNYQKQIDEHLQQELESGNYTFTNPLVVLDPYNESPLTALILFQTEKPSKIKITIPGDCKETTSTHTFYEFTTNHTVPIYGLYPNCQNTVYITQLDENGTIISENSVEIQTEKLPTHLKNIIISTETYQDGYEEGLNYNICNSKFAFDKNGIIRWFFSDLSIPSIYYNTSYNKFIITNSTFREKEEILYEMDKLGKIHNIYYTPFSSHHDIATMPNGNLLILGSSGETTQDILYELDTSSGEIINVMDFKYILQRTRLKLGNPDWMHSNSITYDETDNSIIISSNHQSTIAKISWPGGQIKWLLSSPNGYLPRLQEYLLQPIGENFEYSYNQHSVRIMPDYDKNPDTIDISVFDNGNERPTEKYSRLVHYRINEKNMTVEQIWQFGKEKNDSLYSSTASSFQLLNNDNRLGLFLKSFNENTNVPKIMEINEKSELIWDAEVFSSGRTGSYFIYQTYRLPFYFSSDSEHNIYKIANNFV